jgi:pilus assembly protein FimV
METGSMPTRILLRLFFLAGLLAPWCAFALGVGQLEVRSALNQIFEAELPLITSNPAELTGLVARIPRQEEFDRAGVERLEFLSKLRFSVQTPPGGRSVVRVTSVGPIREPNFNLLLELVWPRGRLIREFTIQLDPELYANRQPPPPPPPVVAPPPPPVVAPPPRVAAAPVAPQLPPAPPVSFEGASFYGPVKPGETLAAVANRVRPSTAISLPQMMAILVAGNPTAFANGNPNTLRSGATLRVPAPQALGAPPPAPPVPELAVASATPAPAIAPAPVDLTQTSPPPASMPELPPPSATTEPGTPPPSVDTTSLPTTPVAEVAPPATPVLPLPPSSEQPREIVPQATIPQPEAPPPAPAQPQPEAVTAPPAASPPAPAQPQSEAVTAPPPAPALPAEAESGWISDPVVWIAIALIALAIAALILLPLLRRPARPKPSVVEAGTPGFPEGESTAVVEPRSVPITQAQLREPRSARPRPAAAAALDRVEPSPGPTAAPVARPIGELLKDFDFDLGEKPSPAAAVRQGATPAGEIKAPLLEAEPPTASVTRREVSPFEEMPAERAEQEEKKQKGERESPASPQAELPSDLRLDGLDFDFGDLGLDKIARPQSSELPPLEMKLETGGTRKPSVLPTLELGIAEPATEPPSLAPAAAIPGGAAMPDLKFEFADVTQEMARHGLQEDSLKLDEALQSLGGDTSKRGGQEEKVGGISVRGMDNADYVETKLDLASAYLDMGDQVGARSLLEEVLQEGNVRQKERAVEFLKKLG